MEVDLVVDSDFEVGNSEQTSVKRTHPIGWSTLALGAPSPYGIVYHPRTLIAPGNLTHSGTDGKFGIEVCGRRCGFRSGLADNELGQFIENYYVPAKALGWGVFLTGGVRDSRSVEKWVHSELGIRYYKDDRETLNGFYTSSLTDDGSISLTSFGVHPTIDAMDTFVASADPTGIHVLTWHLNFQGLGSDRWSEQEKSFMATEVLSKYKIATVITGGCLGTQLYRGPPSLVMPTGVPFITSGGSEFFIVRISDSSSRVSVQVQGHTGSDFNARYVSFA